MPADLTANLATPAITALPPLAATPTPTPQPAPALTTDYMNNMNAMANSIQKSKAEDEEKHQTAVQKTLALALKKQDEDNKILQAEQAAKSAEVLKELAEQ